MRKFIFCTLALLAFAVPVFCQDVGDSIKDALIDIGVKPAYALIFSIAFATFVLQAIPNKYAGLSRLLKKISWLLYVIFSKIDERLNNVSEKQRFERLKKKELKCKLQVEQSKIMRDLDIKKPILTIGLLLIGLTFMNAQSPWAGFFDPVGKVVNQSLLIKADGVTGNQTEGVFKFRTAFFLTAYAIELGGEAPVTSSLSATGLGLSYGNYVTTAEDKPYCKWSVNAAFLTKMEFAEKIDAKLGLSVTGDVFNKIIGMGPGVYFDAGKAKWLWLFNVSVPL